MAQNSSDNKLFDSTGNFLRLINWADKDLISRFFALTRDNEEDVNQAKKKWENEIEGLENQSNSMTENVNNLKEKLLKLKEKLSNLTKQKEESQRKERALTDKIKCLEDENKVLRINNELEFENVCKNMEYKKIIKLKKRKKDLEEKIKILKMSMEGKKTPKKTRLPLNLNSTSNNPDKSSIFCKRKRNRELKIIRCKETKGKDH